MLIIAIHESLTNDINSIIVKDYMQLTTHLHKKKQFALVSIAFIIAVLFFAISDVFGASNATVVRTINTSSWSPPSPDPAGIAFLPSGNLLVVDSEVDEMTIFKGKNGFEMNKSGQLVGTYNFTSFTKEPTGSASNAANKHVFISDDNKKMIFEIDPGADNKLGTADDKRTSFGTKAFGSNDPEGVAFGNNTLFIASGADKKVFVVKPGQNGKFDGIAPGGDDTVSSFPTEGLSQPDPEGIEYNSSNGNLYLVSNKRKSYITEATTTGKLVRLITVSGVTMVSPAGLAASGNSLYIADRGIDNNANPNENDGKVYEVKLP